MRAVHLRVDDTVSDILEHPAFDGFGRLLLPWDDRRVETTMRLREIGSLLPYHTHVDPAVVVSSLNRKIDDAAAGRTVFHDFYTAAENDAEPSRRNTGLFFFRGKPGAPFAVIAPGGAFAYVASVDEGETDGIAPPAVMERRVAALRRAGTDVEYHRYPGVGHGFGLGLGTSAEGWIAAAVRFWAKHMDQRRHPETRLG
jgi:hypothetical protein